MDPIVFSLNLKVDQYTEEGREAFRRHEAPKDCPYIPGTLAFEAWRSGWREQRTAVRVV